MTLAAGAFHIFKIDAGNVADVQFFIDGVRVSTPSQMSFAATGANAILQPYLAMYKASGTGVGTLQIDMVQIASNRV